MSRTHITIKQFNASHYSKITILQAFSVFDFSPEKFLPDVNHFRGVFCHLYLQQFALFGENMAFSFELRSQNIYSEYFSFNFLIK